MSNTPKVRFVGFDDAWEQRKILCVAPLQRGFDLPTAQIKQGEYPVVMSNGIGGYHNEYKVNGPGVVTGRSGTIGKVHFVETNYWPHNTSLWVKDFKGNEPEFIYYLYQRFDLSRFGTGSGVPTLNRNDVHDSNVFVPTVDEQKKILAFLDNLDNLINLHHRKYAKLIALKAAFLDKMFPKKGNKVPELRFAGFVGDWEQCKLSEITSVVPFKSYLKEANDDGKYEVIQQGDNPVLGYSDGNPFIDFEKVTLFGDHTLSLYKPKAPFFVATDGLKILYSEGMDGLFYYYLLQRYKPESEGYKRYFSILKEYECLYTSNTEEQSMIGEFFDGIDKLINLHQLEYIKLRHFKQAMMYNMFV